MAAAALFAIGTANQLFAQSDNFDSGVLDPAWKQANFIPAVMQTAFPTVGTGKGFRIRANPVPSQAPAAALFYRDDVYNPETEKQNIAEIIIGKQRNGPIGKVELVFLKSLTRFENKAYE